MNTMRLKRVLFAQVMGALAAFANSVVGFRRIHHTVPTSCREDAFLRLKGQRGVMVCGESQDEPIIFTKRRFVRSSRHPPVGGSGSSGTLSVRADVPVTLSIRFAHETHPGCLGLSL